MHYIDSTCTFNLILTVENLQPDLEVVFMVIDV